jgi:arylsulfatase A-like enzyme
VNGLCNRRDFLKLAGLCAGAALGFPMHAKAAADNQGNPNILLIVSDDAGYADFGFQGCKDIPTPRLDRLAAGGLRFTQGYVPGCVCSPSRAGILSGKTPARIGHENNLEAGGGIDTATVLLPARPKAAGYHTGAIGKWHLGSTPEYQPWRRGFDEFYGFLGGQNNYLVPAGKPQATNWMLRNGEKVEEKEYLTTAFAREAVEFMERSKGRPWFLYLAFNAVHSPMQADPQKLEKFSHIEDPKRRVLAAMTASLDDSVGRVLDALDATGQAANTLVVFVNDNGGATYSKFYNVPLRGHKGTLFEGGIRVPFLARWPGVFAAGKDYAAPLCATDLLPTFLAAAGAQPSAWSDSDGVNLLPFLTGRQTGRPHETLFWRANIVAAVRDGDWKLIRIREHAPLLFNLANDLSEAHDLAATEPARVAELLGKIAAWEKPFPPARWSNGEYWEKVSLKDHTGPPRYQVGPW